MDLKFTGRGAMLYPSEGNTAAYFEEENYFFLIDCGEDVAKKLINMKKLSKNKEYYLFITHTHSDHIGSLGTLQQYLYWICGKKINIVYDENVKYIKEIQMILDGFGLEKETYNLVNSKELDYKFKSFKKIRYMESNHGKIPLKTASLVIETYVGNILYTGDIKDSSVIKKFISISKKNIDKMYIDTSYTESKVHISIQELNKIISYELKNKVYCMHINDKKIIPLIKEYGFNLVDIENCE